MFAHWAYIRCLSRLHILFIALVIFTAASAAADILITNSGREYEGTVKHQLDGSWVIVLSNGGTMVLPASMVKRVRRQLQSTDPAEVSQPEFPKPVSSRPAEAERLTQQTTQEVQIDLRDTGTVRCPETMSHAIALLEWDESAESDALQRLADQTKDRALADPAVRDLLHTIDQLCADRLPDLAEAAPRGEFETHEEYARRQAQYAAQKRHVREANAAIDRRLAQDQTALDKELARARRSAQDALAPLAPPPKVYLLRLPVELKPFDIDRRCFPIQLAFYHQTGTMKKVKAPLINFDFAFCYYDPDEPDIQVRTEGDAWLMEITGFHDPQEAKRFKESVVADESSHLLIRTKTRPRITCLHNPGRRGVDDESNGHCEGFEYTIELNRADDVKLVTKEMNLFPNLSVHSVRRVGP